jgi:hypothetical protein
MTINTRLLQSTWNHVKAHPEAYDSSAWGVRYADGTETHDFAGTALALLKASFVWSAPAIYPADAQAPTVWGANDVVFSSLPRDLAHQIAAHCTVMPSDRYADYFWASVTADRCPIGLAARVALGIDSADAVVLFEEDAKLGEIERAVAVLTERGVRQARELEQVARTDELVAALERAGRDAPDTASGGYLEGVTARRAVRSAGAS